MLIKVSSKYVLSLPELLKSILRYIYEPHLMSLAEEEMMQKSFIYWSRKVDLGEFEEYALKKMAMMLDRNNRGGYKKRKAMFKEHNIDWRKFHRLPEVRPDRKEYIRQAIKNYENDKKVVAEIK